jgi:acyl carrier protein
MAMTEQEIFDGLVTTLVEFADVPADIVTPEADLASDLSVDSLSMVEVITSAQDRFGIEIPDEDLRYLVTVRDVVSYVRRVQSESVSA